MLKLKYAIPAILVGLFIAGGAWALSVQLPTSVKVGDLLVGKNSAQLETLSTSSAGSVLYVSPSTGKPVWTATSTLGVGGTPGGSNYQLQYNNAGSFGGIGTGTPGTALFASSTSATSYEWKAVSGAGTVTSVDATVPTGLSVSGVPFTTSGTIAITLQSGYNIPLTASTTEWSGFYALPSTRITAGNNLSWSGTTLNGVMASSTIIAGGTATHSPSITFATSTDTNLLTQIVCATSTCTFTPQWTGTLAAARLNSNVVQSVVNDTNVTGSISAQALTLGWTGVLSVARGGIATTTLGNLTISSSNLSITGGQQVLIGTSTQITLTNTPTFGNATFTGVTSLATTSLTGTLTVSSLTSGNCVQAGTGGLLTTVGAACGSGGSGNSAWTIGSGLIYNATSTDSVLVGTSTPTTSTLFVQGSGTKNPLTVASSSGTSYFIVEPDGDILLPGGGISTGIKLGPGTTASFARNIAIGSGATASGNSDVIAIGVNSVASANDAIAIGWSPDATGADSLAIGTSALSSGINSIAIGINSQAVNIEAIAIGDNSYAATTSIAIGQNALANKTDTIAIGRDADVRGIGSIGIGSAIGITNNYSIGLGIDAAPNKDYQMVIGPDTDDYTGINELWFGQGIDSSTITPFSLYVTNLIGSNITGRTFNISSGKGTGNADGGPINFFTSDAGVSGTAQGTLINRLSVGGAGKIGINTTTQAHTLTVVGLAGNINPLVIASSSGISLFSIGHNGSTTIANLTASGCDVMAVNGSLYCGTSGAGGLATGTGELIWSAPSLTLTAGTRYAPAGGGGTPSTTENDATTTMTSAATITNFYVNSSAAIGAGNTLVLTYRKNSVDQSVTCTISGATQIGCSDTTNSFSVAAGDTVTIKIVTTGTVIVTPMLVVTTQYGTTGANGTVNTGVKDQVAYYAAGGTSVSGSSILLTNNTVAGVNATSSTINFNVQGSTTLNPFNVSSSTGTSILRVASNLRVGINSSTPNAITVIQGTNEGENTTTPIFIIASSTGQQLLTVIANGNIGIGSASPTSLFVLQGSSGSANTLFTIASSTGSSLVAVLPSGNVGVGSTSPTSLLTIQGSSGSTIPLFTIASSTGTIILSVVSGTPNSDGQLGQNATQGALNYYDNGSVGTISKTIAVGVGTQTFTNSTTSDQNYTSLVTLPANSIFTNKVYKVTLNLEFVRGVSSVTQIFYLKLGSTKVYTSIATNHSDSLTNSSIGEFIIYGRDAVSASASTSVSGIISLFGASSVNSINQPIAGIVTNGTLDLTAGVTYSGTGSTETTELQGWRVEEIN